MTFAVNDALKRAIGAGVKLPAAPTDLMRSEDKITLLLAARGQVHNNAVVIAEDLQAA